MKSLKLFACITIIFVLLTTNTACGGKRTLDLPEATGKTSEKPTPKSEIDNKKKIKVGITYQNIQNEFIRNIQNAMKVRAEELNIDLIEEDGQGKAENQIAQVENFIARKLDVIILNPYSFEGCKPAVESANKANIPIMTVNNLVANQDKCVTFVGSDAVESGRIQMEYAVKKLAGKGNIVILHGPIGHDAEIGRRKGAQEILNKNPGIKVLFEQSANWSREEGMVIMEIWLQSDMEINAVVAQNDEMALGALKALENVKKSDRTLIFGIDAIPEALKALKEGKMAGTVFQDAKGQGVGAIEAALKISKGQKVEKTIYIPYILVTKDDLAKYEAD